MRRHFSFLCRPARGRPRRRALAPPRRRPTPRPKPDTYLCPERRRRRPRLLPRRGRAPLHDVPAREEHRDHRVRLREVRGRRQRRQERVLRRQAQAVDHAPVPGGAARGRAAARRIVRAAARFTSSGWRRSPSSSGSPARATTTTRTASRSRTRSSSERATLVRAELPAGSGRRHGRGSPRPARRARTEPRRVHTRRRDRRARRSDPADWPRSSARAARSPARFPDSASGRSSSRWPRRSPRAIAQRAAADRRGRHRHRQDVRVSRPGAALRRQGDRLDRHQDAAGPALPARPAAGARRAQLPVTSRCSRAAPTTSATTTSSAPRPRAASPSRDDVAPPAKIIAFARASEPGDRGALADVPENASIWPLVTSTRDNCLGSDCAASRRVLRAEGAQGRARRRTSSSSTTTCSSPT